MVGDVNNVGDGVGAAVCRVTAAICSLDINYYPKALVVRPE